MRNTYDILEKTMRKPLLLHEILTEYIYGNNKIQ